MRLALAYALSPIDLIPDFIPVRGYLDDLVLIPLGIALAWKMIPVKVMADARQRADELSQQGKPIIRAGAILIIAIRQILLIMVIGVIMKVTMKK